MRTIALAVFVFAFALVGGCREKPAPAPSTATVERDKGLTLPSIPEKVEPPLTDKQKVERMLKTHAQKREFLVGGCREDCGDPKTAFYNYMRAIAKKDDGKSAIPYLETSLMVHNGARRGDEWVELWRNSRIPERRESIAAFSKETSAWIDKVVSPDALEAALADGVTFEENGQDERIVYFRHPKLEGPDDTSASWRYRLYLRGWEWLVSEIDTHFE